MFEKMFEMAVVFSAVDHFTPGLMKMGRQMGIIQKQTKETQKQMAKFKMIAIGGAAVTGFGALLADGLVKSAEAAGKLQTSMMGVKQALKLTAPEFNNAMNLAQRVGIPTIFSAEDVGGIMQAMATSGLTKSQVLNPGILKDYVNFADVQAQIKKESAPDVVSSAIGMAHMFQIYNTKQLNPFLNQLNAALLHTHDSAGEFATTFRYISGQAKQMGMNAQQTLAATAWLGRMGMANGRGGTNFADFLMRSIYHSSGKKADSAMVAAGFVKSGRSVFENANGSFVGIPKAVEILQDFGNRFHHDAATMSPLLHSVFGTQGARVAMMMSSSGAGDQYTKVLKQIGGTATIAQSQAALNNTWQGKVKQLQTTLQDIQQAFGRSAVPVMLPLVKILANILGKVLEFEQQHPKLMKFIAVFTGIAAAVMLVLGPMMLLYGVMMWMKASGFASFILRITGLSKIWAGVQWLVNGAMDANPIALIIIGIAALIAIIVLLVTHWKQVVKWVENAWHRFAWLRDIVHGLIGAFAPFIALPMLIITHWKPIETFFDNLWLKHIKPVIDGIMNSSVGKWITNHIFGAQSGPGNGSSYASVSPGSSRGGDTHIHIGPGAIVVQAAPGRERQAGNAVYSSITGRAVAASRSRGARPVTSYGR